MLSKKDCLCASAARRLEVDDGLYYLHFYDQTSTMHSSPKKAVRAGRRCAAALWAARKWWMWMHSPIVARVTVTLGRRDVWSQAAQFGLGEERHGAALEFLTTRIRVRRGVGIVESPFSNGCLRSCSPDAHRDRFFCRGEKITIDRIDSGCFSRG